MPDRRTRPGFPLLARGGAGEATDSGYVSQLPNLGPHDDRDMKRILTGIQPSGILHIGNYFGAIRQYLELQDEFPGQCYFFIADYHALTTLRDADELRRSTFDLARTYGYEPGRFHIARMKSPPPAADELETSWHRMILTLEANLPERPSTVLKRARSRLISTVRLQVADIGSGDAMPVFDRETRSKKSRS